jgi:uncharacterized membrane protein
VDWLRAAGEAVGWRTATALMLAWLAIFFGRTLLPGRASLIERIARVSEPDMPPVLCRYTRWLTAIWCAYFALAAALSLVPGELFARTGLLVWVGTVALFVGEHWLRPRLFPGHAFPGLLQQLRDTWSVWHPRRAESYKSGQ